MIEICLFHNKAIVLSLPRVSCAKGGDARPTKEARVKVDSFRSAVEKRSVGPKCSSDDNMVHSKLIEVLEFYSQKSLLIGETIVAFKPYDKELLEVEIYGLKWIHDAFRDIGHGYTLEFELTEVKCHGALDPAKSNASDGGALTAFRNELIFNDLFPFQYRDVLTHPLAWRDNWELPVQHFAKITLKIVCGDLPVAELTMKRLRPSDPLCLTKKLLQDSIATDFIIVSKGGFSHRCHRSFLIAHSSIFEAMFKNEWKNDTTVTMNDISQDGLHAVLEFLYYWALEKPANDLKIALEVLKFSNKYKIQNLESAIGTLILAQPVQWFVVDATLELYLAFRGGDLLLREELEKKAVEMMKVQLVGLLSLPEYKDLATGDPDMFFELTTALLLQKDY